MLSKMVADFAMIMRPGASLKLLHLFLISDDGPFTCNMFCENLIPSELKNMMLPFTKNVSEDLFDMHNVKMGNKLLYVCPRDVLSRKEEKNKFIYLSMVE